MIDDVYIPIVTDPCYNVEPAIETGFEMDRLQLYKYRNSWWWYAKVNSHLLSTY